MFVLAPFPYFTLGKNKTKPALFMLNLCCHSNLEWLDTGLGMSISLTPASYSALGRLPLPRAIPQSWLLPPQIIPVISEIQISEGPICSWLLSRWVN